MAKQGLFIDYHYCTGCHTCEVACQQENQFEAGQYGITVTEHVLKNRKGLSIDYVPFVTDLCNLCVQRTTQGKKPACVKHCLAACISFGTIDELAAEAKNKPKGMMFVK